MTTIRTENMPSCILCKSAGKRLFDNLPDRRFYVEGTFGINRCPRCGLLWLDPRPIQEDIGKCYDYFKNISKEAGEDIEYYNSRTFAGLRGHLRESIICGYFGYRDVHTDHRFCSAGKLLGMVPLLRRRAAYDLDIFLPFASRRPGALFIDVGCGYGELLNFLKHLGWNVLGVEPNARAADISESKGMRVIRSSLENARLPPESAVYISMSHVIEHFSDPALAIRLCWEALKPGGKLIITTPNIASYGYTVFKKYWYALDVPRHLYLFSPSTIRSLLRNYAFRKITIKTSSYRSKSYYDHSAGIRERGRFFMENERPKPARGRLAFAFKERFRRIFGFRCGEEISVVAIK